MKAKKKIILQIGKNLCSLALVLIMMICIIPQMTVKADNVGTTEEKLEEDWGAMSSAAGKMNMTNTTTKAQVMKVITAAAKNGTKAEWKSFRKVDATYESKGGVTAYLNLSLDGKTRELYINEVIPTLGNNRPEKGIAVSEDEWNILRLTNIERAKEGKILLTMPAALQKATAVRAKENVNNTQPAHTRPNGTSYKTAVPSSFKTTGLGENMYKCTKPVTAQLAMRGWMNSASHKANILRENYQYLGVGTYETEAVQIFASSNKKIKSYTTSTGKTTFADEEAMAGEYLICTDQAGIQVDVNNGGAGVRGVSKIYVYKGSKKIKTFTSAATSKYTFTYKAKGAGSAKYKAKVEMIENKNDAKTSKAVSPKANTYSLKVSTKLSDYEEDEIKFVTQSLSYSGNTIIVKGYTVNTMGADLAYPFYTYASCPGKLIYQYRSPANKVIKKGIHKYTFKVKNVSVVDLRHCGINVK